LAKQSLLVADADPRSLRILDVALRKAGFSVATAADGAEALRRIQRTPPDLILADVALPGTDGVALCRAIRGDARLAETPVILISSSKEAALKLSAHEAGADDFLGKPLLIKELTTRIRMLLTRREQENAAERGSQSTLIGEIGEMGLVDLIQSLETGRRSGEISCEERERKGQIWVREGQVVDAEAGALTGEAAFYRILGWESGKFLAQLQPVDREPRIEQPTSALIAESVRRVDELGHLAEVLPISSILTVDLPALTKRLADLPDEVNGVIRLCDGVRTIAQVMERAPLDELSVLAVLQRLIDEKILIKLEPVKTPRSKPSLSAWLGPNSVATPAPPIMGAHGQPQSGDPTPIAPPVSDPPAPYSPSLSRPTRTDTPRAKANADSPRLMLDTPAEPLRIFDTPADPIPAPAIATPGEPPLKLRELHALLTPPDPHPVSQTADTAPQLVPAGLFDKTPAEPTPSFVTESKPVPMSAAEQARVLQASAPVPLSAPKPFPISSPSAVTPADPLSLQLLVPPLLPAISPQVSQTDLFKLPAVPKQPVPVHQFSPMRGVRRERLRHEADEARAQVAGGKPVRLTHVVELPTFPIGSADFRRRISPAVGEAAKKFAPDSLSSKPELAEAGEAPLLRVVEPEPIVLTMLPDQEEPVSDPLPESEAAPVETPEPEPTLAAMPTDDGDAQKDGATMQVEPLSPELLAPELLAAAEPALAPNLPAPNLPAPTPIVEVPTLAPAPEIAAAAKSPWDESTDPAVTSPGTQLPESSPALPEPEVAAASTPLPSHEAATSPGHRIELGPRESGERKSSIQDTEESPAPAFSDSAINDEIARIDKDRRSYPPAAKLPAQPPAALKPTSEADFEAEMNAALKKGPRWPIYVGIALLILALVWVFRPQPPTDKNDSPWLADHAADVTPAPAAAPAVAPLAPLALDAGLAQASTDAGTAASTDAGTAVVDAGALAVAPPLPAPPVAPAPVLPAPVAPAAVTPAPVAAAPSGDEYAHALAAGEALLKRGKYKTAVGELKKAVALNPEAVPALLELGDAYLESDSPRSALKPLQTAAKLDPRSSRAQLLLGTAWQSLGKNADAIRAYQRYLEMDPSGEYARDVRSILANLQK
jgi:DNA-binding response OmpR family regulator/tetratricopeptide (TPR) repeat protein